MEKVDAIMTIEELAVYLQLHPLTVRSLARAGELPTFKVGRQWRVRRDMLDRWLEEMSMQNLKEAAD
ncbi:MAG: helix-turn-helix domain-containing protein [Anaerolineae bacterium]|nr:helix-turn-helix domain-containing protein [Anaerolineae bacterium]